MKFRIKIMLCVLCLLALLFGIGGSALISISFSASLKRAEQSAHETYQMLLNTLQIVNRIESWKGSDDVSNILSQLLTENPTTWSALRVSSKEETVYQAGASLELVSLNHEDTKPEYCLVSQVSSPSGQQYLQLSGAFVMGDETLFIDTLHDITSIYEMHTEQQKGYQYVYLCMVIVCALLTYSISWLLTRPLGKLTRASKAIASGDLTYRSGISTNDEIGDLSSEFDNMASQMEKNVEELKDAMDRQTRFTRSFTHELKTPMASIIGHSDLMRRGDLTAEEQGEAANYIFSEAKRLENLSIKLLEIFVTDNKELALRPTVLSTLIEQVVASYRPKLDGTGIKIYSRCTAGTCYLEPNLVWSLLVNLLDNAQKALDNGGRIDVVSQIRPDGCRIFVTDNGRGIPEGDMQHITEAFYRARPLHSQLQNGAGLGLALCVKIVELHHGTMTFKSKVGEGTRVTVVLKGGKP